MNFIGSYFCYKTDDMQRMCDIFMSWLWVESCFEGLYYWAFSQSSIVGLNVMGVNRREGVSLLTLYHGESVFKQMILHLLHRRIGIGKWGRGKRAFSSFVNFKLSLYLYNNLYTLFSCYETRFFVCNENKLYLCTEIQI